MIAPQIEEMSKSHDNVVFLKVDVDEAEDAAQEFNVSAMPTFIFMKSKVKVTFARKGLVSDLSTNCKWH